MVRDSPLTCSGSSGNPNGGRSGDLRADLRVAERKIPGCVGDKAAVSKRSIGGG